MGRHDYLLLGRCDVQGECSTSIAECLALLRFHRLHLVRLRLILWERILWGTLDDDTHLAPLRDFHHAGQAGAP